MTTLITQAEEIAGKLEAGSLKEQAGKWMETLTTTPSDELFRNLVQDGIHFGLKVVAALLIYLVGGWIIRKIKRILTKGFERKHSDAALASFVTSLVSIALWVIVIIITISTLGINTTSLAALLAAGGMAIGMALSGTVQNFAGGIMILVFKPFKAGDYIEAQGFAGVVTDVSIVSTKLLTIDNRVIVLPNGALFNGSINNLSAMDLRRVDLPVSVAYGSDASAVRDAILEIVAADPLILDGTTQGAADPFVALKALGSSSVDFIVRVWVKSADYWTVYFRLNEAIYAGLPAKGIPFPFPQLDVHLKKD